MSISAPPSSVPSWMVGLLAAACGLIVANIYYAQPLISLIAPDIGMAPAYASLIVTLTQAGYCAGLLLLVPLGDLHENRRLVLCTMAVGTLALLVAAGAGSEASFLGASLFIGLGSVAVQMLVPIAAHLAPDASRGVVVGKVISGLLVGIMLSRPVASLVADAFGWRVLFGGSALMMVLLGAVLWRLLPVRQPEASHRYADILKSMWTLLRDTPVLRRRAAYQAAMFAAFTLYWTAVPLVLSSPVFGFTQTGIALFALAGVAGALSAPIAGKLADQGKTHLATGVALAMAAVSLLMAWYGGHGSLVALLGGGILLDLGVQANLVLSQREIYTLGADIRSRLNGIFMALFFVGGAVGSSLASVAYTHGGWSAVSLIALAFPVLALAFYATE